VALVRNFHKIAAGIDVGPLMLALHRHDKSSGIWREDTYLRKYPQGPFGDCESVILRFPTKSDDPEQQEAEMQAPGFDQHENLDQPVFKLLPEARPLIFSLMSFVQGERLGRVIINKLRPGGVIYPHADSAPHCTYYDRFHIVLQSMPGVVFRCESEKVYMGVGEAWWFDNSREHEVINNSADDRIHMVIDIRTSK